MYAFLTLLVACVCLASYGQADLPATVTDTPQGASSDATTLFPSSMPSPTEAKASTSLATPAITSERPAAASTSRPSTTPAAPAPNYEPTTGAVTGDEPPTGNWSVTDKHTNVVCIVLLAGIQLQLNLTNSTRHVIEIVNVPSNGSQASGNCNGTSDTQSIDITFYDDWVLSFEFKMNTTTSKYDLYMVNLTYNTTAKFPWAVPISDNFTKPLNMFDTDSKKRYECMVNKSLVDENAVYGLFRINTFQLKFEAFRSSNSSQFDGNGVIRCTDDEVSQLVPIIVGAALGGLIIIVLVAYLIGRKRSRRGYESV